MRGWQQASDSSDGLYAVNDFKSALYQLVVQQCLYARFQNQGMSYRLISRYRREFTDAADLMGLKLGFNDRLEYCYVVQDVARHSPLTKQDSLFLLALRHVYHLHASSGDLTEEGDAIISLPEFQEEYRGLTQQDLDAKTHEIKTMFGMANRHGLARLTDASDDDAQPFSICILPGIADVLSEYAVGRFGASLKASLLGKQAPNEPDEPAEAA